MVFAVLTVDFGRLGLRPGERVLDLGCGAGRHAAEARRLGAHVVAFDLSEVDAKDAAGALDAVTVDWDAAREVSGAAAVGDAAALPFPEGAFDRVIAAEVFEHLPEDRSAIGECFRVLRPGGVLAVTVPRWFPELICWALSDDLPNFDGGHQRIYRRSVLSARLAQAGFAVQGHHHAHALHSPYWWLRCAARPDGEHCDGRVVRRYGDLLERHEMERPVISTAAERVLNPLLGKSLVLYAAKSV